jgi:hypothetical protein
MNARQCGDCSLCCKVLGIPELDKPKDQWCPNFLAGTGCRIYTDRPPSCRDFVCRWLTDPAMGPEWKPNVCKLVIDSRPGLFVVHVDPAVTRPWGAEPYLSALKRLSAQGLTKGVVVMAIERRRTIVILPDREVDLGVIAPEARIAMEPIKTSHGTRWQPRVMGAGEVGAGQMEIGRLTE